jgi:hypothetical protein
MHRTFLPGILLLLWGTGFAAQRQETPPPKPSDDGFNLEVNMKFIEDKLNLLGRLNYIASFHDNKTAEDGNNNFTSEITLVRANPQACRIDLHDAEHRDGEVVFDKEFWFSLKTVEDVVVIPREQQIRESAAAAGNTNYTFRVEPPVYVLIAKRADGESDFYFRNEALAGRVAKALTKAVELCGGGKKPE